MCTITPLPCGTMCASAAWLTKKAPLRQVSRQSSQSASVISRVGFSSQMPALPTRMSRLAEAGHRLLHHTSAVGDPAHVAGDRSDALAGAGALGHGAALGLVAAADHDAAPFGNEALHACLADARRTAGHQGDLVR